MYRTFSVHLKADEVEVFQALHEHMVGFCLDHNIPAPSRSRTLAVCVQTAALSLLPEGHPQRLVLQEKERQAA